MSFLKNPDYIKFVISRVESDFAGYSSSGEYEKVITILRSMKSADNILREAYVLSGIKKLRKLAFYIIFMYKKIESNRITLDNFLENFRTDKEFLGNYLQTYYNLEAAEVQETEEPETEKFNLDGLREPAADESIYSLSESTFRIETLESKLVNEEFIESNLLSDQEITEDRYLRLVEQEIVLDGTTKDTGTIPEEGDVFSLPVNLKKDKTKITETSDTEAVYKETKTEESSDIKSKNLADFFEQLDGEEKSWLADSGEETKQTGGENVIPEKDKFIEHTDLTEYKMETIPSSDVNTDDSAGMNEKAVTIETDSEVENKLKEIEKETSEELINSDFIKYESELYIKNDEIRNIFDELITIANDKSPDYTRRDLLLKELCDTAWQLKDKSGSMTFEIITRIYDSVIFCFSQKFKDIVVSEDTISVFREAINGVEKLVRGDDLGNFSCTIKKVENVENELKQMLELREEYEKKKYDFGEEEKKIIEEFKNNSEKEAYLHLRDKILELEKIFVSQYEMKDKIHPFESLRKLSSAFTVFREIVNVSGILEMNKLARLAEAGYVFVKFIQNYRLDPFKEDVTEVFKFMIYSFKLIYLDKPVKELEVFISYLNDPVKIFHQKKTNQ
ncbi:MAG: hypothetical protein L0Y76_04080 [Ignavibacteria bacterium]|nr:hypothetical protein [Ignavibacteria bacterium]